MSLYHQPDPDWTYLGDIVTEYDDDEFDDYDEEDDCVD